MTRKMKFKLNDLKVQSFVTSSGEVDQKKIKGGTTPALISYLFPCSPDFGTACESDFYDTCWTMQCVCPSNTDCYVDTCIGGGEPKPPISPQP